MGSKDLGVGAELKDCDFIPEEQPILNGVNVRGATVDKLVQLCIEEFDENGPITTGCPLSTLVFQTHGWFISSEELLSKFGDLYVESVNFNPGKNGLMVPTQSSEQMGNLSCCKFYSHGVKELKFWMANFSSDIKKNGELLGRIEKFQHFIDSDGDQSLTELISFSHIGHKDWNAQNSLEPKFGYACRSTSIHFQDLSVAEIAEQMTYLEYKALRRIRFVSGEFMLSRVN